MCYLQDCVATDLPAEQGFQDVGRLVPVAGAVDLRVQAAQAHEAHERGEVVGDSDGVVGIQELPQRCAGPAGPVEEVERGRAPPGLPHPDRTARAWPAVATPR